jgi:very-short-patch-repair endonuclease
MRTPNIKCIICGKPLYRRPYELKKVRFVCCKNCRSEAYKKYPSEKMLECLKLGRQKGDNHRRGIPQSEKMKSKMRIKMKEWIKNNPDKFKARIEKLKETKKKNRKGIFKNCLICGKEFYVYPSYNGKGKKWGVFCSKSCAQINRFLNKKIPQKNTSIEKAIENVLKREKIKYEKQRYFIEAKTIPDFYLPEYNAVIYCDGNYWHSKTKRKNIDEWQNKKLTLNGYKVFRFTETEIKNSPENCIKKLKEELCIK